MWQETELCTGKSTFGRADAARYVDDAPFRPQSADHSRRDRRAISVHLRSGSSHEARTRGTAVERNGMSIAPCAGGR